MTLMKNNNYKSALFMKILKVNQYCLVLNFSYNMLVVESTPSLLRLEVINSKKLSKAFEYLIFE